MLEILSSSYGWDSFTLAPVTIQDRPRFSSRLWYHPVETAGPSSLPLGIPFSTNYTHPSGKHRGRALGPCCTESGPQRAASWAGRTVRNASSQAQQDLRAGIAPRSTADPAEESWRGSDFDHRVSFSLTLCSPGSFTTSQCLEVTPREPD